MNNNFLYFNFQKPIHNKTLYLDKDGVLNDVVMRNKNISSPRNFNELTLSKDLLELEAIIKNKSFNTVIISNQPDISRGLINKEFLLENINKIRNYLSINVAFFCPHTIEQKCNCRKPRTKMILHYRKMYPHSHEIEHFIGDTEKDAECAKQLNINFILKLHNSNKKFVKLSSEAISNFRELEL